MKLNLVGETYLVRGNADKAADLFAEVIELWPADMEARNKVIEMLKMQGRVSEAVGSLPMSTELQPMKAMRLPLFSRRRGLRASYRSAPPP